MVVIFSVRWTITTLILQIVVPPEGLGSGLDRDSLSLLMLTAGEGIFYYFYLKK